MGQGLDDELLAATMGTFGRTAQWTPKDGGAPFELVVELDERHAEAGSGEAVRVSASEVVLTVRLSDFDEQGLRPRQGDLVSIGARLFTAADVREDGYGAALVPLLEGEDHDL